MPAEVEVELRAQGRDDVEEVPDGHALELAPLDARHLGPGNLGLGAQVHLPPLAVVAECPD